MHPIRFSSNYRTSPRESSAWIKGISPNSVAVLLPAIGDINDFKNASKLTASVRIVPRISRFNETDTRARITKQASRKAIIATGR